MAASATNKPPHVDTTADGNGDKKTEGAMVKDKEQDFAVESMPPLAQRSKEFVDNKQSEETTTLLKSSKAERNAIEDVQVPSGGGGVSKDENDDLAEKLKKLEEEEE